MSLWFLVAGWLVVVVVAAAAAAGGGVGFFSIGFSLLGDGGRGSRVKVEWDGHSPLRSCCD